MRKAIYILLTTFILLGAAFLRLTDLHRFPPGLHYDEAADLLLSRDIAFYGYRPFPVVAAYSGRESLFYYTAAPLVRLFGTEVMATRLTSTFLGILTVAVTIALGRAMFRRHGLALLAGAWLAVNGAQVWLTRQGFRTSPQPLLEALALWLLWLALRRQRQQSWLLLMLLAGGFAGMTLYVYMAARIFPIWLALPLGLLLLDSHQRGLRFRQIAVFFAALTITALPILFYYVTNLDVLTDRLEQLAPAENTPTLLQSVVLHLQMFFLRGDPLLRYNLYPGRPFFDVISGFLLIVGVGAALSLLFRHQRALVRAASAFVVLSPLLIAPSVFAVNGLPPSHMRSVAMVPLIFFLPALGAWLLAQLFRLPARLQIAAAIVLFVTLGGITWWDYRQWGSRADLFYDSDGDLNLAASWLEQQTDDAFLLYIASTYYQHPTVLSHNLDPARLRWMMAEHIFLPPPGREAMLIFPRSVPADRWREVLDPAWRVENTPHGPDGAPAFEAYRIPASDAVNQSTSMINIANEIVLIGFSAPPVTAGTDAVINVRWQITHPPTRDDIAPIFELRDQWGERIARVTPYFQYSSMWLAGEQLIQRVMLPIPAGSPPGTYQVVAYWAGVEESTYLPVLDRQGRFAGIEAVIGTVEVAAGESEPPDLSTAVQVVQGIYAVGVSGLPSQIGQGETLRFAVTWYAQSMNAAASLQLRLEKDGQTSVLEDGHPVHDTYPIRGWQAGELVIDRHAVRIPADAAAGDYVLTLTAADALQPVFRVPLTITKVERSFVVPVLAVPLDLDFGKLIRLRGYTTAVTDNTLSITLAWQSSQLMRLDYTQFIHVALPDGTNFSQIDSPPPRPTSQWIAGEVFTATYTLPVPPDGNYEIHLGLYLQTNGARLPVTDENGADLGDMLIIKPPL